jgi:hypothetical protein
MVQRTIARGVLGFLGLGIRELHIADRYLKYQWDLYPQGTRVHIAPDPMTKPLRLVKHQGVFCRELTIQAVPEHPQPQSLAQTRDQDSSQENQVEPCGPCFVITFKSLSDAWPILLGRTSIQDAYLENRMVVSGDLMIILPLVRGLMRSVRTLFPRVLILGTLGDEPESRPTQSTKKLYWLIFKRALFHLRK